MWFDHSILAGLRFASFFHGSFDCVARAEVANAFTAPISGGGGVA